MDAKTKALEHLDSFRFDLADLQAINESIEIAILDAKKEVFDDIKQSDVYIEVLSKCDWWNDFEKRHLSTFAEQKRHNNNFRKVCPHWKNQCSVVTCKNWTPPCNCVYDGKPTEVHIPCQH